MRSSVGHCATVMHRLIIGNVFRIVCQLATIIKFVDGVETWPRSFSQSRLKYVLIKRPSIDSFRANVLLASNQFPIRAPNLSIRVVGRERWKVTRVAIFVRFGKKKKKGERKWAKEKGGKAWWLTVEWGEVDEDRKEDNFGRRRRDGE